MNTTLYRCLDAQGCLLYVGISSSRLKRFSEHRVSKGWWEDVTTITLEHFPDRLAAVTAETEAIRSEGPRHNGQPRMGRQEFTAPLEAAQHVALKIQAANERRSMNAVVTDALRNYLDLNEAQGRE